MSRDFCVRCENELSVYCGKCVDVIRDKNESTINSLREENQRFRKLFDDAGQGEHNVLALIDFYQKESIESTSKLEDVRVWVTSKIKFLDEMLAHWTANRPDATHIAAEYRSEKRALAAVLNIMEEKEIS